MIGCCVTRERTRNCTRYSARHRELLVRRIFSADWIPCLDSCSSSQWHRSLFLQMALPHDPPHFLFPTMCCDLSHCHRLCNAFAYAPAQVNLFCKKPLLHATLTCEGLTPTMHLFLFSLPSVYLRNVRIMSQFASRLLRTISAQYARFLELSFASNIL